jgi:hypothetical protein
VLSRFDQQLPTDKVEGDALSKFVDYINQHLVAITPARSPDALLDKGGDVRLYLHHCEADSEYALNLAQALQQRQLETLLPAFEGPDSEIKSFNGKQLAECDAVVLCWAKASEVWVRAEASGLRDWHQLGRKQQFFYRAVIAAPPPGSAPSGPMVVMGAPGESSVAKRTSPTRAPCGAASTNPGAESSRT